MRIPFFTLFFFNKDISVTNCAKHEISRGCYQFPFREKRVSFFFVYRS